MTNLSRRNFIFKLSRNLALGLAVLPFARMLSARASDKKPIALPPGQKPVLETDPVASALGYHRNVKEIDYTRYPQRKLPEAKNQFCKFCANYTPANEGWGKCVMFGSGVVVSSEGWCSSWVKKN
jgi:hypothetical protein